jgi:hypothetical protein
MLPSDQNLSLDLLITITLEVVPFREYSPFTAILTPVKCILKYVFCESVQHRLRFCLDRLS